MSDSREQVRTEKRRQKWRRERRKEFERNKADYLDESENRLLETMIVGFRLYWDEKLAVSKEEKSSEVSKKVAVYRIEEMVKDGETDYVVVTKPREKRV